jgi:hypothetical protein
MLKNREKFGLFRLSLFFLAVIFCFSVLSQAVYSAPLEGFKTEGQKQPQTSPQRQPSSSGSSQPQSSVPSRPHVSRPEGTQRGPAANGIFRRRRGRGGRGVATKPATPQGEVSWHSPSRPPVALPSSFACLIADKEIERGNPVQGMVATTSKSERIDVRSVVDKKTGERTYVFEANKDIPDGRMANWRVTFLDRENNYDRHVVGDIRAPVGEMRQFVKELELHARTGNKDGLAQTAAAVMFAGGTSNIATNIHVSGEEIFEEYMHGLIQFTHIHLPQYRSVFEEDSSPGIIGIYQVKEDVAFTDNRGFVFVGARTLSTDFTGLTKELQFARNLAMLYEEGEHNQLTCARYAELKERGKDFLSFSQAQMDKEVQLNELAVQAHKVLYLRDLQKVTGLDYSWLININKIHDGNHAPAVRAANPVVHVLKPDALFYKYYDSPELKFK